MYRPVNQPFQFGECGSANYSLKPDNTLRVINSQRFFNFPGDLSAGKYYKPSTKVAGFTAGITPVSPSKPTPTIDRNKQTDLNMGVFSNNEDKSKINDDYMQNERFGNYRWKFDNSQGMIFQYTQAEGMARKLEPEANDGRFQLKFSKFQPVWGNYHVLDTDY